MSKFTTVKTQLRSRTALLKALAKIGYTKVDEGEGLHLYGYQGDRRAETAEIVVRRAHIGESSNDLGFKRLSDGTYSVLVSEYDRTSGLRWSEKAKDFYEHYGRALARQEAKVLGYRVVEKRRPDGRLSLTLKRGL